MSRWKQRGIFLKGRDNMYNNYDNEQVIKARNANLAEYFQTHGYDCELKRDELHIKGFGGFNVNVKTNQWYCFAENKGGNNSINCLKEMLGMDFKTAVKELTGSDISYSHSERKTNSFSNSKKELKLPEKADNMRKVFAYLCKTRGLSNDIVSQLARDGLLYQDVRGNAVFVHKDDNGEIIGAEIQGTNSEKRFKGVAQGTSDSLFSVKINKNVATEKCYVFESAIDLLSFKQLANPDKIQNAVLVSMAGLKPNALQKINSKVKIYSCVDADEAGDRFTQDNKLKRCKTNDDLIKFQVKDYNDLLRKLTETITLSNEKPVQNNQTVPQKNFKTSSHSHR